MDRRRKWIVGGSLGIAALVAGTGIAAASAAGDDDKPLRGSTLESATGAAVKHVGGGTVIETEVGDDGAAYGVEIRLDDGRVVEVALDESFAVIGQAADDDGAANDQSGPSDD
jgi:hypothetical protein